MMRSNVTASDQANPRKQQNGNYRLPLFLLLMVCFAAAILGDSTAEALLLSHFDAQFIPRMFLVNALFLFISSACMMSIIDRVDRGKLFLFFTLSHGVVLFFIRMAVLLDWTFLFLPLFSYAYITKILLFLLFWTLANDLIDSRKAGSEFPVIAAGGTTGAIIVSFSVPWLMKLFAAENLLFVWSGLVIVAGLLFMTVQRSFGRHFRASSDRQKQNRWSLSSMYANLKIVRSEPLLWNMSILYFLIFFILLNQQFTFYALLKQRLSSANALAAFIGFFTGISMFVTWTLQLTISGRILKKAGSTRSMLLLPIALTGAFGVLFIMGCLGNLVSVAALFWGVVIGVGIRIAFFDSFFSPNFQIFFSSLPQEIRGRGKLAMEGVIKPLSIVLASLWIMLVAGKLSFAWNAFVLLVVAVLAIVQVIRLKPTYIKSLTRYLTGFSGKNVPLLLKNMDLSRECSLLDLLGQLFNEGDFEIKEFVIELLAASGSSEAIAFLTEQLESEDPRIRATVVASLGTVQQRSDLIEIIAPRLADSDHRVVANAVLAMAGYCDSETLEGLEAFLLHVNSRVRCNTIITIWPQATPQKRTQLIEMLGHMLYSEPPDGRSGAIYALGEIDESLSVSILAKFRNSELFHTSTDPSDRRQLIRALAKKASEESLELMLGLAEDAPRKERKEIAGFIGKVLLNMPIAVLVNKLHESDYFRRNTLVCAVYAQHSPISAELAKVLQEIAESEIAGINRSQDLLNGFQKFSADSKSVELLKYAIHEECIERRLDTVTHIAGLLDERGSISEVLPRLNHRNPHVRARAFEVLDNTGDLKLNKAIMKLLDNKSSGAAVSGTANLAAGSSEIFSMIQRCAQDNSTWVSSCSKMVSDELLNITSEPRWLQFAREADLVKGG